MQKHRHLMDKILLDRGTACFTFPVANIGVNGGYKTHTDNKDVLKTLWVCGDQGTLVFPEFELSVHLQRGDVIRMSYCLEVTDTCMRTQFVLKRLTSEPLSYHLVSRGMSFDRCQGVLNDLEIPHFDQLIGCLYFQSQQRAYLVNSYNNRRPPEEPAVV